MKQTLFNIIVAGIILTGCDKWSTTDSVSHISYIPEFTVNGGEFISVIRSDTAEYEDEGAIAFSDGRELKVYAFGDVDLARVGVYIVRYYALNGDNLIGMGERIIAVTYEDVSANDLSGTYNGTLWDPVEMRVVKADSRGLYTSTEVLGYYNFEMKGRFVDIGRNELVLLPGEGYLGRYGASMGYYTLSTLGWSVRLIDPPNDGIEIDVLWRKKE